MKKSPKPLRHPKLREQREYLLSKVDKLYYLNSVIKKIDGLLLSLIEEGVVTKASYLSVDTCPDVNLYLYLEENLPSPVKTLKGLITSLKGSLDVVYTQSNLSSVIIRGRNFYIDISFSSACTRKEVNPRTITTTVCDHILECGETTFTGGELKVALGV